MCHPGFIYDERNAVPDFLFLLGAPRNMVREIKQLYRLFGRLLTPIELEEDEGQYYCRYEQYHVI
jgi:hypothetical protein